MTSADEYAPIAEIYDAWCREVTEDVPFYRMIAADSATPIVELAAGTGRISVPLAQAGHRVIAVDRSAAMLERLQANAETAGVADRIDVVEGDLLAPNVKGGFDRVLIPFRSLLHLRDDDERRAAMRAARDLLAPDGRLAFDVFHPTPEDVASTQGRWYHRDSGARERADWLRQDGTTLVEVEMRGRSTTLILYPVLADNWLALLAEAGFEILTAWGDFESGPVRDDGTGDLVVVCVQGWDVQGPDL